MTRDDHLITLQKSVFDESALHLYGSHEWSEHEHPADLRDCAKKTKKQPFISGNSRKPVRDVQL